MHPVGPPAPPEGLDIVHMADNPRGVILSWRAVPHDLSRPLDGYLIQYHKEDESPQEVHIYTRNSVSLHVHLLINIFRLNMVLLELTFSSLHCFLVKLIKCPYKLLTVLV